MEKISDTLLDVLLEYDYINNNDIEAYKYGLIKFVTSLGEISFILMLSAIMQKFIVTLLWLIGFIPLRIFSGGYHANSKQKCFLTFIFVYIVFLILERFVFIPIGLLIAINIITLICIIIFAPLRNANRYYSNNEVIVYKRIAITIFLIDNAVIFSFISIFQNNCNIQAFVIGVCTAGLALILGKITRR